MKKAINRLESCIDVSLPSNIRTMEKFVKNFWEDCSKE